MPKIVFTYSPEGLIQKSNSMFGVALCGVDAYTRRQSYDIDLIYQQLCRSLSLGLQGLMASQGAPYHGDTWDLKVLLNDLISCCTVAPARFAELEEVCSAMGDMARHLDHCNKVFRDLSFAHKIAVVAEHILLDCVSHNPQLHLPSLGYDVDALFKLALGSGSDLRPTIDKVEFKIN